ncbi:D-alanine--D-alanine ligase [Allochromatium vinosum]|uniref:D-alanine--D-alanine ligase n=1 Tax=Allochromatium vinosum (strain ATCC 17899 / DSM 180 / NBRC 103801 / NCIMB 10441 / D) TaxID=572477 RepID=D3RVH8_ALLVD|nr:D-alanine--D-alanine ligase [Allochromatium vinosum]ADC61105.1 D-alanine/D-alanine ligase [Allochromatium vinosum DSM 180]
MTTDMNRAPERFGKVALLMGGQAAEREISLKSGRAVHEALQRLGVDVEPIDPDATLLERLRTGGYDRAFIILHGRGGEDGQIQGALETIGLPYTGSGVLGSALGMDKYRCKLAWAGCGLPTADFVLLRDESDLTAAAELGFPLMIKPVHEGSSIGMARVESVEGLERAWRAAAEFDSLVLAERWIQGMELTCAILGHEALPTIRLETPHAFYDYEAKYSADSTRYHCPSGLDAEVEARLRALALEAFDVVGASGWGRVDMMLDGTGQPFLLEINTVPGMTDHSLVPMAARVAGIDFDDLVWRILETSL